MLSIITPILNGGNLIEQCIKNVINQRCQVAEHIIVDGGSTDSTIHIIQAYACQYSHIRWVSEKDKGQSDAMNKGIRLAKGSVISFLNVDDYYEPDVLNRISDLISSVPEPSLLIGNCKIWRDNGELLRISKPHHLDIINLLLRRGEFPQNPSSYFYHKSLHNLIGFYNIEEHFNMDVEFIYDAVQKAHIIQFDEVWGNYRMLLGTKTKDLVVSGNYWKNYNKFLERYLKKLPWSLRIKYTLLSRNQKFNKYIKKKWRAL